MLEAPTYAALEPLTQLDAEAIFGAQIGKIVFIHWGCGVDERGVLWHVPLYRAVPACGYYWDPIDGSWRTYEGKPARLAKVSSEWRNW